MAELKIVEKERKTIKTEDNKCQVQVKNSHYSRSFTVHGMDIEFLFEQIFTIIQKIVESPTNHIRIICYKPPEHKEDDHDTRTN